MTWVTALASALALLLGAGGTAAAINAFARRGVTKVEAAERLSDAALELVEAVKADAAGARHDAREARLEAHEARLEMVAVRQEAEALARELRRLRLAIVDPYATLERLRAMVPSSAGEAGGPAPSVPI